jgi:hypothetical protein
VQIEDRDDHGIALREGIINFWADFHQHKQCVTFGALLHEIKTHELFKKWGHKSFYWYCRTELHLRPVNIENAYIQIWLRCRYFGLNFDDMRSLERKYDLGRLLRASKIAPTRAKFLFLCASNEKKARLRGDKRILSLGPYRPPALDLMKATFTNLSKHYGCTKDEVPMIMAILSILVTFNKGKAIKGTVKRLCNVAKISQEIGGKIVEVLE